ncbi:Hypothetical predicted protein [Octopus vulgaris]|uniref:Large ribosomal subunit protein mL42 n=2 Tax=Octopus TaxID=6643 RepID=A0AA36ATM5_OCTVU|nr:Hypothetical predicted protein [Octopus vulgaris]
MTLVSKCIISVLQRPKISGIPSLVLPTRHNSSGNAHFKSKKNVLVGTTDDNMTFVCWHPEIPFPYEYSKPLPRKLPEIQEAESPMKVQHLLAEKLRLRPDGPTNQELANIFFTTKHRWFPKPEKRYKKPNEPKDRERL